MAGDRDMQPVSSPRPRASLASSTLLKMGGRIAVVIALTTIFSYFHILRSIRAETLSHLEQHVLERSEREQALFLLGEDNHAFLKKTLEARIQAWRKEDPDARFDSLFARLPDGTIRNHPEGFDGTLVPGVFIPRGVTADTDLRRRVLAAYDVASQYGPAFHSRFTDTYIMLTEGVMVGYAPEMPTVSQKIAPDYRFTTAEYFTIALPANNPRRQASWTGVYQGAISKTWMASVISPLDMDGRHIATIGHDVTLTELIERTHNTHYLPGTYNMLIRDDGQLIAHPELKVGGASSSYNILSASEQPGDPSFPLGSGVRPEHLRRIFERMKELEPGQVVLELPEYDEYIAVARLKGPGWNYITVMPRSLVSSTALGAARYVLLFGMASLLLELAIMYWVLKQQISRPLLAFTQATDRVATGDFQVGLDTSRNDELGRLASAFRLMAGEVQHREEALRQANEGLELRVEERTRELKETHRKLVETAREAGRAEIATSVLHNVGNVLNTVHTSTLLAQERVGALKLDHMGRLVAMLEEHQGDLATFLTQDVRGQHVLPFLKELGLHLQDQRQELRSLLADASRYTDHINTIIKLQQRYAKATPMQEAVDLAELVKDALRINEAALGRHAVSVEQHLTGLPPVMTDKHRLLTILVNLISNAKYAMDANPKGERCLTMRLDHSEADHIRLEVRDNGVGISPELLTRIFQYGFTTREEGHGFGLHSSALAAQEMGGSLTAHSEGPGRGATFILELPYQPALGTQ
ncbi:ATP-binding protein [Archangium lansingense]|nr:ATP-binding protein [Archangium lansinium]